jgi:hypothetical protein
VVAWKHLRIRTTYGPGNEILKKEIMVDISKFAKKKTTRFCWHDRTPQV